MLILTRGEFEEVLIGDPANPIGIVKVMRVRGDRVRLGFEFPRAIPVHRREVAEAGPTIPACHNHSDSSSCSSRSPSS